MSWHKRYLLFYLLCGIIASLSHVFATKLWDKIFLFQVLGFRRHLGVLGIHFIIPPQKGYHASCPVHHACFCVWAIGIWIVFQIISGLGMLGGSDTGV
jgi:membrane associated rhomboid family serine protease